MLNESLNQNIYYRFAEVSVRMALFVFMPIFKFLYCDLILPQIILFFFFSLSVNFTMALKVFHSKKLGKIWFVLRTRGSQIYTLDQRVAVGIAFYRCHM